MAAFTDAEQAVVQAEFVKDLRALDTTDIPFSRPDIWAASQAIRDILDSSAFRISVSSAINAAISPNTMTNAQKKRLFGRVIQFMWRGETT